MNDPTAPPPSSSSRICWLALFCLLAAFAACVGHFSQQLPERVATHFGMSGSANGWMTRSEYRNFTLAIGLGTPLFIIGVFLFSEKFNGLGLNISNKEYWLAPERRAATYAYLYRHASWLASLLVLFYSALFYEILRANTRSPAVLSNASMFSITGALLVVVALWVTRMILRFRLPKK